MSAFVAFFATRWLKRAALANDQAMLGPPEQLFSEDCLTLDIYAPKGTTATSLLPVTVYIHGGCTLPNGADDDLSDERTDLQTGSPSCHLNNPSKLIDVDEPRIWVCVTYRLSVFGFLANPAMGANWGFLDQWYARPGFSVRPADSDRTALQWVQENISAFGGDPQQVTLMGQSAGAHSTQQLVHHASRLSDDVPIPFQSAHMISNGVASQPKSLLEAQAQYDAFAHQLGIDPEAPDSLDRLRDVPTAQVIAAVEALGPKGAFRGITDNVIVHEFMLEWQSSGRLAKALARKGFRRLIIGETVEEVLSVAPGSLLHRLTDRAGPRWHLSVLSIPLQRYGLDLRLPHRRDPCSPVGSQRPIERPRARDRPARHLVRHADPPRLPPLRAGALAATRDRRCPLSDRLGAEASYPARLQGWHHRLALRRHGRLVPSLGCVRSAMQRAILTMNAQST
jgi:hypothetical protein